MYSPTQMVLWLLAGIAGFVFGIFLASSLKLYEPMYIFSLAGFFSIICITIAYHSTRFFITRLSGRMFYVFGIFMVLGITTLVAFLLFGVN